MVSHHPATFSGYRHCGIVVVTMFLVCQVISQVHVTKGSCDFKGRNLLR